MAAPYPVTGSPAVKSNRRVWRSSSPPSHKLLRTTASRFGKADSKRTRAVSSDRPAGIPDRADHLRDILDFIGNDLGEPTKITDTPVFTNRLAQNYPNPFNPTTTIRYSIKEHAHVTLKIDNVAGQLVKTLVNEKQQPRQEGYSVQWNGLRNDGQPVSSGAYFYRLKAGDFVRTKKMVLMK
jgi:hypothetical protein